MKRYVSPYDLLHVELAHLYWIFRKGVEQALPAVYDDATDAVSARSDAAHCILIVLGGLVLDKRHIQRAPCGRLKRQKHTKTAPSVCGVKMDKASAIQ